MTSSARAIYEPVSDPDAHARQANEHCLDQVAEAFSHGREVNFAGAQKHMRFSWKNAVAPVQDLMESLYDYFGAAANVKISGGGAHPFAKENMNLAVHLVPVMESISHDGMGTGLGLLGKYLEDPLFQSICTQHNVSDVYTPSNDLEVPARRVQHYNQPRPL